MTLLVVEGDQAIGEDEGRVWGLRPVGGGGSTVGLELVAEVTGETAIEFKRQPVREVLQPPQLAAEVVEDRLVVNLHPGLALHTHLPGLDVVGDDRAERALAVSHKREATALALGAAVEPEGVFARPIYMDEGPLRVRKEVESALEQPSLVAPRQYLCLTLERHRVKISRRESQPHPRSAARRLRDDARPRWHAG